MGVRFLTVNKICFKHFVLLLLCVCLYNWSVSQWKQYELQIWSSWRNIILGKWKAPRNLTPKNGHAHGECFWCFHLHTLRIKTLPQLPICTEEIPLYTAYKINYPKVFFLELEAPKYPWLEHYVCWNVSWPASTDNLGKNWLSFVKTLLQSLWCVTASGANVLPPNVWVVFKIYFAILHTIVAISNVQQSIRLNKQKGEKKVFALLHYIQLAVLHIWVICFLHMATWKRCSDMWKMCGNISEDWKRHNVQLNLNVHWRFSQIFRLYDNIYIGICRIF